MLDMLVLAAAGALGGWLLWRWLRTERYRYADEHDIPSRSAVWVVPALALLMPAVHVALAPGLGLLTTLGYLLAVVALVAACAIDLDVRRLPNLITLPLAGVVVAWLLLVALLTGEPTGLVRALLAGPALAAFYLVLAVVSGGSGLGLGDVKLALPLGLLLGRLGWVHVGLGTFLAFASASLLGLYLVLVRRAGRKATLAFGPHMVIGACLMFLAPLLGRA